MRLIQRWGSALAVVATGGITLVCLADDLTGPSLLYGAWCLLLAIAPPLAFGALSLRRDQSLEAAWAQLLTTLGIAGYLASSYLDVAFQAFGPHRHSSTESLVFILAPVAAFPLGSLAFALVWAVGKLISYSGWLAEREYAPISRAAVLEQAQEAKEGAGRREVRLAAPRGRALAVPVLVLAAVFGVAYAAVSAYWHELEAKDPSTPRDVLVRLAEKKELQYLVAQNPSTPPATLVKLAALPDPLRDLSVSLSRNPSTPPEVLCELAELTPRPGTFDWEIRMMVERNPSTPLDISDALKRLPRKGKGADWMEWPKESQPDCAQFKKHGP
jgi:hypothetical protein